MSPDFEIGHSRTPPTPRLSSRPTRSRPDLGDINGEPFVNAASLGAYPLLVAERERLEAHIGRWPAAVWSVLRVLLTAEPIEVEVDGQRRRVWELFIGNGRYASEGIVPTRRDRLDEGVLDVRIIDADKRLARTRIILSVLANRLGRCAAYERRSASQVHIRSPGGPLRYARDGETTEGPAEVLVRKRTGALLVLQPGHVTRTDGRT